MLVSHTSTEVTLVLCVDMKLDGVETCWGLSCSSFLFTLMFLSIISAVTNKSCTWHFKNRIENPVGLAVSNECFTVIAALHLFTFIYYSWLLCSLSPLPGVLKVFLGISSKEERAAPLSFTRSLLASPEPLQPCVAVQQHVSGSLTSTGPLMQLFLVVL